MAVGVHVLSVRGNCCHQNLQITIQLAALVAYWRHWGLRRRTSLSYISSEQNWRRLLFVCRNISWSFNASCCRALVFQEHFKRSLRPSGEEMTCSWHAEIISFATNLASGGLVACASRCRNLTYHVYSEIDIGTVLEGFGDRTDLQHCLQKHLMQYWQCGCRTVGKNVFQGKNHEKGNILRRETSTKWNPH